MRHGYLIVLTVLALCTGILAGRALPDVSVAAAANTAAPVGTVYYKTVAGGAFLPADSSLTYSTLPPAGTYVTNTLPQFGLRAFVDLPNGATITNVTFFYMDNLAGNGMDFAVQAYNPATGAGATLLASGTTQGIADSPAVRSISLDTDILVNNQNAYLLRTAFSEAGPSLLLYGARVTYVVPANVYLPSVVR